MARFQSVSPEPVVLESEQLERALGNVWGGRGADLVLLWGV